MTHDILVIPSARRMMGSLRDIGYDLPSAVADLIDNSIDAGATRVDVDVRWAGDDSWLRISDNGRGMDAARLDEAMRYGSARDYEVQDLGKFGLGLKTASLSQCRVLSVASKPTPASRLASRRWDLDRVGERDEWRLERLTLAEAPPALFEPLVGTRGTVVLWQRLDRVLGYKLPDGLAAENGLTVMSQEVAAHIGMVFHRFLDGSAPRRRRLRISVNGLEVEPWDPFCPNELATRHLPEQVLTLRHGGRRHTITVRPFILPSQQQFSTQRERERASGPLRWNRQQGFYFYRAGRLIQSGGWNRLRTTDEHTKLARIAIDIPPAADGAFEVNVSKMRILLPAELRAPLKAIASGVAQRAQDLYRGHTDGGSDGRALELEGRVLARHRGHTSVVWSVIQRVLDRELSDQPELRARLLAALTSASGPAQPAEESLEVAAG